MTVCSSDLKNKRTSSTSSPDPSSSPHPHTVTAPDSHPSHVITDNHSPTEVRKKFDADVELDSQSSSVETLAVHDHVTRSSRSATPTPAISIEPDALDINLTAAILSFDDNEVVTTDTTVAKARSSGDHPIISYSDVESNDGEGTDDGGVVHPPQEVTTETKPPAAASNSGACAPDNDSVSC